MGAGHGTVPGSNQPVDLSANVTATVASGPRASPCGYLALGTKRSGRFMKLNKKTEIDSNLEIEYLLNTNQKNANNMSKCSEKEYPSVSTLAMIN